MVSKTTYWVGTRRFSSSDLVHLSPCTWSVLRLELGEPVLHDNDFRVLLFAYAARH